MVCLVHRYFRNHPEIGAEFTHRVKPCHLQFILPWEQMSVTMFSGSSGQIECRFSVGVLATNTHPLGRWDFFFFSGIIFIIWGKVRPIRTYLAIIRSKIPHFSLKGCLARKKTYVIVWNKPLQTYVSPFIIAYIIVFHSPVKIPSGICESQKTSLEMTGFAR